ncbi:g10992 [Coccomyxa viridis]|uniref:G10992 protein n=1 Tax=Coccomyxa viridis TaxID=1274662 RepID=A0ABP1G6S5_9CHLO
MAHLPVAKEMKLNSGTTIPTLGLGVFLVKSSKEISTGLSAGYRHIDSARYYQNEAEVGRAVRESGIPRDDIFVTTKVWLSDFGYESTKKAVQTSLQYLDGRIDLMLMHAPGDPSVRADTWRALEEAKAEGGVRDIGVSNFGIGHIEKLLQTAKVVPAVNQIELSPFLQRKDLVAYCRSKGIALEAYSPLGKGTREVLEDKTVRSVAQRQGRTNAQVLIRWSLQQGFITLPKSSNAQRQQSNLDVFSFELDDQDMEELDALDRYLVTAWDPTTSDPV